MTKNQKAYRMFLKTISMTAVCCVSFVVVCTNYDEPEKVEYSDIRG